MLRRFIEILWSIISAYSSGNVQCVIENLIQLGGNPMLSQSVTSM